MPDIATLQAALADAKARADAAEDKAARAEAEAARVVRSRRTPQR